MNPKPEFLGEILEPLDFFNDGFKERQTHIKNLLNRYLNTKTVVAFIGAGTSLPLGYPSWWKFSEDIISILRLLFDSADFKEVKKNPTDEQLKFLKNIYADKLMILTIDVSSITTEDELKNSLMLEENEWKLLKKKYIDDLSSKAYSKIYELEKEKKHRSFLDWKWKTFQPVLEKLKYEISKENEKSNLLKENYNKAQSNYDGNKKNSDKNNFTKYAEILKTNHDNELDALFIFSECERLLSDKDEWNDTKQSPIFRCILDCYFNVKHDKVSDTIKDQFNKDFKNKEKKHEKFNGEEFRNLSLNKFKSLSEKYKELLEIYNPYFALLNLPIKKFVTPNYDLEIERALLYKNKIENNLQKTNFLKESREKIIEQMQNKSFSQNGNFKELANFSVSRYEETNYNVFHCHGRIDQVESCIVTEEDYQKWYLKEDKEYKERFVPFRQSLDLILDSNPILFVGFGLKDADLMRLLRQITANRPIHKNRTPLFCLLYVDIDDIKDEAANKNKSYYKWNTREELEEECKALYLKYGLHVIPVEVKNYIDKFGNPICLELHKIKNSWEKWWEGILEKPKFRKSPAKDIKENAPYFHYKFIQNNYINSVDDRVIKQIGNVLGDKNLTIYDHITKQLRNIFNTNSSMNEHFAKRLAIVVGDGGTGKSWGVQKYIEQYLEKLRNEGQSCKIFFWSAYYSNDVITGIDRLIEYFSKGRTKDEFELQKEKFVLLREIIDDKSEKIIVFDGIEKLLVPNDENTEGISVSPEVKEFFKIISHRNNTESRIILTSRIFPVDILYHLDSRINREEKGDRKKELEDEKLKIKNTTKVTAPKCWLADLNEDEKYKLKNSNSPFYGIDEREVSSICSLVNGHIFGISLISGILATYQKEKVKPNFDFEKEVENLIQTIANTPIDRRIQNVIEKAIKNVDRIEFGNSDKIVEKFVERIALFMHPVRREIAEVCYKECESNNKVENEDVNSKLTELLDKLVEKSIVQKVEINPNGEEAFVVHPLIKSYVFERIHKSLFSSLPSLQLPGFSSGKDIVDPGAENGKNVAISLFKKLCEQAKDIFIKAQDELIINREDFWLPYLFSSHLLPDYIVFALFVIKNQMQIACDMCRAAFSILRSRFCSNTVARWGSYDDYLKLTVKLYDTAKKVSEGFWKYHEPTENGLELFCESNNRPAPLYADELAWVYNEVGLTSLSMGNNLNATALWEQGYEINKLIDRYNPGRYLFQSRFNLGAVNIYYGKLGVAQTHLDQAFEIANKLGNKNLSNRVLGYRALLKYLQGNLEEAENDFVNAYNGLESNSRARSLFYCFYGELLLKKQELDKAEKFIEQSRHLAEAKHYPDLIAYSRLSKANILLQKEKYSDSQYEFQYVLKAAKEKSLFRLEAATLSGLSRLAERLGDYQSARLRAIESLKISNEYSLGLHQTVGLLVLGKALVNNNLREFGIAYLKAARDLAKSQGYFLRSNEAEQELRQNNVDY